MQIYQWSVFSLILAQYWSTTISTTYFLLFMLKNIWVADFTLFNFLRVCAVFFPFLKSNSTLRYLVLETKIIYHTRQGKWNHTLFHIPSGHIPCSLLAILFFLHVVIILLVLRFHLLKTLTVIIAALCVIIAALWWQIFISTTFL